MGGRGKAIHEWRSKSERGTNARIIFVVGSECDTDPRSGIDGMLTQSWGARGKAIHEWRSKSERGTNARIIFAVGSESDTDPRSGKDGLLTQILGTRGSFSRGKGSRIAAR
jgi:hypothetical protein